MLHVFSATDTNLPTVNYEMPLKFVSALQSSNYSHLELQ